MKNELVLSSDVRNTFPGLERFLKEAEVLLRCESFEDISRHFLEGAGLSQHTYRSYLQSLKSFYEYSGGLNPLQIVGADIERWFDGLLEKNTRSTARLRVQGLKRFLDNLEERLPFYQSPFKIINGKLRKKLFKAASSKKGKYLTAAEVKKLLNWLSSDTSILGQRDHAVILFLVTSGLRASEALHLQWKDIELVDSSYIARFTGKGDKEAEVTLYNPAVQTCLEYFQSHFHRAPQDNDYLFYRTIPGEQAPLCYQGLFYRLKEIGKKAKEQGIITRDVCFSAHLFRRTCGTLLDRQGYSLVAIANHLRHSNVQTTAKHYVMPKAIEADAFQTMTGVA